MRHASAVQAANDEGPHHQALQSDAAADEPRDGDSGDVEPAEDEAEAEERKAERHSVLLSAQLQCGVESIPVRLRNISRTGARVEAAVLPPIGSIVRFIRGDLAVSARVVWVGRTSLGLEFRETIDEKELLVGIGRGQGAAIKPLKALFPSPPPPPPPRVARDSIPKPLH